MQKRSRGAIGLALALVAALVPSSHAGRVVAAAVPGTTYQVFPANNDRTPKTDPPFVRVPRL